jgi:hypothetical protein
MFPQYHTFCAAIDACCSASSAAVDHASLGILSSLLLRTPVPHWPDTLLAAVCM